MIYALVTYVSSCRELNSQASKVFLTSDFCENRYLCFLVESHQHLRSTINVNISHISNSTPLLFIVDNYYAQTFKRFSELFLQMCEVY